MNRRESQNHPDLPFEEEPKPGSILNSEEFKKAKETNEKLVMEAKTESKMYRLLTPEEREEHARLKTPSEKREYIVRKYSKIFPPENVK